MTYFIEEEGDRVRIQLPDGNMINVAFTVALGLYEDWCNALIDCVWCGQTNL